MTSSHITTDKPKGWKPKPFVSPTYSQFFIFHTNKEGTWTQIKFRCEEDEPRQFMFWVNAVPRNRPQQSVDTQIWRWLWTYEPGIAYRLIKTLVSITKSATQKRISNDFKKLIYGELQ